MLIVLTNIPVYSGDVMADVGDSFARLLERCEQYYTSALLFRSKVTWWVNTAVECLLTF